MCKKKQLLISGYRSCVFLLGGGGRYVTGVKMVLYMDVILLIEKGIRFMTNQRNNERMNIQIILKYIHLSS